MDRNVTYSYNYSSKENEEILGIRRKYLPKSESKLDELRRLDMIVQSAGIAESLCAGVGGMLIFGSGLCFAMHVIASGVLYTLLGVLLGIIGIAVMLSAYPIYRSVSNKSKLKHAPRILALSAEFTGTTEENNGVL